MKKIFFVLLLVVVVTPVLIGVTWHTMKIQPEARPVVESEVVEVPPDVPTDVPVVVVETPAKPSESHLKGYWDGYYGKWLGPIRWTINDDYRQGHMLGSHDKKQGGKPRYPLPK